MRIRIQPDVPHGDISFAFSAYETIIDEKKQDHIPLYYHVHPELELFWIMEGSMKFQVGDKIISMEAGNLVLVRPDHVHGSSEKDSLQLIFRAILIDQSFVRALVNDLVQQQYINKIYNTDHPYIFIEQDSAMEIVHLLNRIYEEYIKKNIGYELLIKSLVYHVFYLLIPYLEKGKEKKQNHVTGERMKDIVQYIEKQFSENITLTDIANHFAVSEEYFSRYFKKSFNITFSNYLLSIRLNAAKEMLRDTDLTITEIAFRNGFTDPNYFTTCFKKMFQSAPRNYRKMIRAKI